MTRQQAIAGAPQTRKVYWVSVALWGSAAALFTFFLAKIPPPRPEVWGFYLLATLLILILLQSAERLAFPERTALRSRALNIKFGRRVSAISLVLVRTMFGAAMCVLAYHLVRWHGGHLANALISSGLLLSLFTHDLLGHKVQDSGDDFEHSPPLTDLKPLQSEQWGTPHTS